MDSRKIKLIHPDAKIPLKKHPLDAGYDCYLIQDVVIAPHSHLKIPLGFAIEVKPGEILTIRSRSSVKTLGVSCMDSTCDAGYIGQLSVFLVNHSDKQVTFLKGHRVVQLVFIQLANCIPIVEGLLENTSTRGESGFGSSGK